MTLRNKSVVSLLVAVVLIVSMFSTIALAAPSTDFVVISSEADLEAAILSQQDGQTWLIKAGDYGIPAHPGLIAAGQGGWYFPITADNLTIIGEGNPVLHGKGYIANGCWASQSLIAVFGDNCSISGITLMPKEEVNKTVEVVGDINFKIMKCTFKPNPGSLDGGALYFSGNGETGSNEILVLNNTFDYAPIALDGVSAGSVKIMNNTFTHIGDGLYAIGNVYWGAESRLTMQYSDIDINNNSFENVKAGDCIIKARLNQTFSVNKNNSVNGAKLVPEEFSSCLVLGNVMGSRYGVCDNAKVIVGKVIYTRP